MREFRQAEIARALGVSEMTVSRAVHKLGRQGAPMAHDTALSLLAAAELQELGLSPSVSLELLSEHNADIAFCLAKQVNRTWIVFIETESGSFRIPVATLTYLESLLDAHPLSLVLPLHQIVARAKERLEQLKSAKEAA